MRKTKYIRVTLKSFKKAYIENHEEIQAMIAKLQAHLKEDLDEVSNLEVLNYGYMGNIQFAREQVQELLDFYAL